MLSFYEDDKREDFLNKIIVLFQDTALESTNPE